MMPQILMHAAIQPPRQHAGQIHPKVADKAADSLYEVPPWLAYQQTMDDMFSDVRQPQRHSEEEKGTAMPLTPISPSTQGTHADPPARQRAHASANQHLPGTIETRHVDAAAAEQAAQPAVRVQSHKGATHASTAGHIFALRDGSGYVIQGSDGHYYRLDASASSALAASPPGIGYVDSALVNVNAGTVSIRAGGSSAQLKLPGSSPEPPTMPLPLINNAGDAKQAVNMAHALIQQWPATALRSHANLDPTSVLLLLR